MPLSGLSFDCLSQICDLAGNATSKLIISGDRRLQARLRPLKSLEVALGIEGGYLSFEPLYALLSYFSALKQLSVKSCTAQQLYLKKLRPEKLPSTLESLKLNFWRAVSIYLDRPSFYASLPNLRALELSQTKHFSSQDYAATLLSLEHVPSSLRELRILNAQDQFFILAEDLEYLPRALEAFDFDGDIYGVLNDPPTHFNIQRFHSLHSLKIQTNSAFEANARDYPPTITHLEINTPFGFQFENSSFSWHKAFPSLVHLAVLHDTFQWSWLLEMPFSIRTIHADFEPFHKLSAMKQQDVLSTLTSRNDNFASLKTHYKPELMVPSQMTRLAFLSGEALPDGFEALFTGVQRLEMGYSPQQSDSAYQASDALKGTILPEKPLKFLNECLSYPHLREVNLTDNSQYGIQLVVDPLTGLPRKLAPSLYSFCWSVQTPATAELLEHFLPFALQYSLKSLRCSFAEDISGPSHLARFSTLEEVHILQKGPHGLVSEMTSSRLSEIIPSTVSIVDIDLITFDAPLTLHHLDALTITGPIDLSCIHLLPNRLEILQIALREPIDVYNEKHRAALLSFPLTLKRLRIARDDIMDGYEETLQGKGIVFNKQTIRSSLSKRVADQCTALELLTRKLKSLIELDIPVIALPDDESFIQPQSIKAYLFLRIPFLNAILPQPDLLGTRSKRAACLPYTRPMVSALKSTSISTVNFIRDGASTMHQQKFDELFMESKGLIASRMSENPKAQKRENALEKAVFWSVALLYHLCTIIFYGFSYSSRPTMILSILNGQSLPVDLSDLSNLSDTVLSDASFLSSLLGLPRAIVRLRRELRSNWNFATLRAPHDRLTTRMLLIVIFMVALSIPNLHSVWVVDLLCEIAIFACLEGLLSPKDFRIRKHKAAA